MRFAIVLAVALLAACGDDGYGVYLEVRGDANGIKFDRLEFVFGKPSYVGTNLVPGVPIDATAGQVAMPTPGALYHRAHVDSDDQRLDAIALKFTYFLPHAEEDNTEISYVLVRAYLADVPVGVADIPYFENRGDEASVHRMQLAPYDAGAIHTWPPNHDLCLRYDRPNKDPSTVVVGRENDADCDGFTDDNVDCQPLVYCDGVNPLECAVSKPCVAQTPNADTCSFLQQTCSNLPGAPASPVECGPSFMGLAEAVCLPEVNCHCPTDMPPDEYLECAIAGADSHPAADLLVPIDNPGHLCTPSSIVKVTLQDAGHAFIPCDTPQVEALAYPEYSTPTARFKFEPGTYMNGQNTLACTIKITAIDPANTVFDGFPHILLSVKAQSGGGRIGTVIGFKPDEPRSCTRDREQVNESPVGACAP
ncbi:MAG TPA: hypothetical protein VGM39_06940 [Kofleriaceae bacterium]